MLIGIHKSPTQNALEFVCLVVYERLPDEIAHHKNFFLIRHDSDGPLSVHEMSSNCGGNSLTRHLTHPYIQQR